MDDPFNQESQRRSSADYKRLSLTLGIALAVLVGTTIFLIVRDRLDTWETARRGTRDISIASQVSISGLFAQSSSSLAALRSDMPHGASDGATSVLLLKDAMRFDPLSSYLGVKRGRDGSVTAVDHQGNPPPSAIIHALQERVPAATGADFEVTQLFQLPGDATWYLPLALSVGPEDGEAATDTLFALISGTRLVAGVKDVYPAADAFVAVLGNDGRRLVKYLRGTESFQFNGPPIRPDSVATINRSDTGNFETWSSLDGIESVFGFAHSSSLPIVIVTGVPLSTLNTKWIQQSIAPTILLLLGVSGITLFGYRLRRSLREQWAYLRRQEYLANHDALTGLRNRDSFMRMLASEIKRAPAAPFGVVIMDLNHFKDVNDTLGHGAGDQLLCELGQRLIDYLSTDESCVARLGGDEIAVFVRRPSLSLADFATELQRCISKRLHIAGVQLDPSASMGGALYPQDAQTASELMRRADIAMYAAKTGSQRYCRYAEAMDSFSADRLAMKADLATAISEDILHLVYQPKVSLKDGTLVGCEALARWEDRERGSIPPITFIPVIEHSELIHPFTEYVLRTALRQAEKWRSAGYDIPVSVNISANNLHDDGFIDKVMELLAESGMPPHLLELEITESAVMRNPDATVQRLCELRDLGLKLSIDDFGTGHASLAYLKHLPVNTLKIDKGFVSALSSDAADRRIVSSAVRLAHDFDMTVVAEGVETEGTVHVLREYGCDYAQGYHFAKPLQAADFEAVWFARCAKATV